MSEANDATDAVPQETTQFVDVNPGISVGAASAPDEMSIADAMDTSGLTKFLSRPVRILQLSWQSSDAVGRFMGTYSPWRLFFSNQYIKYKLNNYAFIRCNLKLKIVVNASQFYYGAMKAVYTPMSAWIGDDDNGNQQQLLMKASQKPGVWIDPSRSEGAEMTLPFFYHRNYLKVNSTTAFEDIGDLRFYTFAPLQSANGVASSSVSIQVYAWAENVVLSGPTLNLALQGDEYGTGVVSGPASAVAKIARSAKDVPVIGKFAAATEIGAGAVSRIAKLFGFTNTPVLDDTHPFRPTPFPQLASTEIGYPVEKLTVDSKNELSVDPTICGLPAEDELAVSYIAGKESYLMAAPWLTSDPVDTNICTMRVQPYNFISSAATYGSVLQVTPQAMLAQMFSHWRGDLIYTFKFITTPFHKGRVRISYDPLNANMQTATDIGSVLQNTIVDLGASREVEVRVPYQQALSWMRVDKDRSHVPFGVGNAGLTVQEGYDNGIITMKVLTTLSAPVTTAPVYVIVMVRGAENLEFANPTDISNLFTPFPLQGLEVDTADVTLGETKSTDPNLYRVNFGEKVASLRPLLRRSNFIDTVGLVEPTGTTLNLYTLTFPRKPPFVGFDPNAWTQAQKFSAAADAPFTWAKNTAWHWISRCFIAQRGAMHWTFNFTGTGPIMNASVTRLTSEEVAVKYTTSTSETTPSIYSAFPVVNIGGTSAGVAITNGLTQPGISVSVPNMTGVRFQSTRASWVLGPDGANSQINDGSKSEFMRLNMLAGAAGSTGKPLVARYAAAGTDYSLFFFLACPTWYVMPFWPLYPLE